MERTREVGGKEVNDVSVCVCVIVSDDRLYMERWKA